MKYVILILAVFLTACNDSNTPTREPTVRKIMDVEGCQVKYIDPPNSPNFYIARCGSTTTTTWQQQNGKSTTTYGAINVESESDLRNRLAEVEARDKALAKLSPEDKKALGLK